MFLFSQHQLMLKFWIILIKDTQYGLAGLWWQEHQDFKKFIIQESNIMSKGHLFVDTMLFLIADCILLIVCICLNINKYLKYKKILLSDSDCARYKSNFFFIIHINLLFYLLFYFKCRKWSCYNLWLHAILRNSWSTPWIGIVSL